MANPIVIVNVTQQQAPTPNNLQKTGAFISQGGTTIAPGHYALITEPDDLTPLLAAPLAITSIAWASTYGGQITVTTAVAHGVAINSQFVTTIAGALPAGYNGNYLATATGASTFVALQPVNPGTTPAATPGTYTPRGVGDVVADANTFFSQGSTQSVYVLELGAGEPNAGVTALGAFITASPQFFYSYLVPRNWDANASFLAFLAGFETTTSKTYFFVTTTEQTYQVYTPLMKCVIPLMEAPTYGTWAGNALTAATFSTGLITATTTTAHGVIPGQYFTIVGCTPSGYNGTFRALTGTTGMTLIYAVPADPGAISVEGNLLASVYSSAGVPPTEFTHASDFYRSLNFSPSSTNKVPPFSFGYLFGVTQFPLLGNSALLTTLKNNNISIVGSGNEGGLTNSILKYGRTKDNRPFNYWYSVDWMQINLALDITNELINGSNTSINPLYYNQGGIDRLQQRALGTGTRAINFGLALGNPIVTSLDQQTFINNVNNGDYAGQLVINAEPFPVYTAANPSDYRDEIYGGLSMVYTPQTGFIQIIININVTDFVSV